jgi:hypothetical protein
MLYREIIAVCSEIHTKHINTERRIAECSTGVTPLVLVVYLWVPSACSRRVPKPLLQ